MATRKRQQGPKDLSHLNAFKLPLKGFCDFFCVYASSRLSFFFLLPSIVVFCIFLEDEGERQRWGGAEIFMFDKGVCCDLHIGC